MYSEVLHIHYECDPLFCKTKNLQTHGTVGVLSSSTLRNLHPSECVRPVLPEITSKTDRSLWITDRKKETSMGRFGK